MKRKHFFKLIIPLVLIIGILWWLIYEFTYKGDREIGILEHPCSKIYSIHIFQHSEFDNALPVNFSILKNKRNYKDYYGQFEVTNNTREDIKNFEVHCYDNIIYVTWKNDNIPLIMFDIKSEHLFPYVYEKNSYVNDKYKKELFEKIKIGNQQLRIQ